MSWPYTVNGNIIEVGEGSGDKSGCAGDRTTWEYSIAKIVRDANIVMSDDATMNSKPELEIYADDVKCSHGSTTGQFDDEAIFYLKARGLSDSSARHMLAEAFVGEVTENVKYML